MNLVRKIGNRVALCPKETEDFIEVFADDEIDFSPRPRLSAIARRGVAFAAKAQHLILYAVSAPIRSIAVWRRKFVRLLL
jgi:hypothetical protein